ncbi:MAG: aminopeptidase [Defluviitaleaceae bacterium]|nr:aminopeptidase [Defluviitaleaceae bacterium]
MEAGRIGRIRRYAELIVRKGVNVQAGQRVVVFADIEAADFARLVTEAAYDAGAAHVYVNWSDEAASRTTYLMADPEEFKLVEPWRVEFYKYYDDINACYIFLDSDDPDLLSDVEPERIYDSSKSSGVAFYDHNNAISCNHVRWTLAGVPSGAWASKLFPDIPEEEAVELLWEKILDSSRVYGDPLAAWDDHDKMFKEKIRFLNGAKFSELRFTNSLGTDIRIGLPQGHFWDGGSNRAKDGVWFFPNIPTEEVFTLPDCRTVNGRVVASMPLTHNCVTIENFELIFEGGKVVSYKAEKNEAALGNILNLDEGARMLGEVALVPHDSPISRMKLLFKNSLYDENASCHFALGKAYPMIGSYDRSLSKEEADGLGVNDSITHVDFMFGTADLRVTGTTSDGKEVTVFVNGNWA